jgi:hypothetical protein
MLNESIYKKPCEKYLFEDYLLKGCMGEQICKINVSGSYPQDERFVVR